MAPQVLVNVDHGMKVMMEETFGPVVGIMKVKDDDEAIKLINDSPYGLTASIWSKDEKAFERLVDEVETGTVFLNRCAERFVDLGRLADALRARRCDYLDPALAWTGVKESGRGISLSRYGFDAVTRAKSIHIRAL